MIFFADLKKSICLSLLGHIALFSIFSFSFGQRVPRSNYPEVSFWGGVLRTADLRPYPNAGLPDSLALHNRGIKEIITGKPGMEPVKGVNDVELESLFYGHYLKPAVLIETIPDKAIPVQEDATYSRWHKKDVPAIMFYPSLPPHLLLYFKDRQLAHIELAFNISRGRKINPVVIKRKISSGNLEVDLLSMRYISHYLFIQQAAFPSNTWQTVKIELSSKDGEDDKH